jgi:hypothetical protein
MSTTKSKHAFGSEANVDNALQQGLIDAYDILFLAEGKIGWIDKNGQKVILEDRQQVKVVSELPRPGDIEVIYIYNSKMYIWDGAEYTSPTVEGGVDETTVDEKIGVAVQEVADAANAYTDTQIDAALEVVEF